LWLCAVLFQSHADFPDYHCTNFLTGVESGNKKQYLEAGSGMGNEMKTANKKLIQYMEALIEKNLLTNSALRKLLVQMDESKKKADNNDNPINH
jgi:hypothetical protein